MWSSRSGYTTDSTYSTNFEIVFFIWFGLRRDLLAPYLSNCCGDSTMTGDWNSISGCRGSSLLVPRSSREITTTPTRRLSSYLYCRTNSVLHQYFSFYATSRRSRKAKVMHCILFRHVSNSLRRNICSTTARDSAKFQEIFHFRS